MEEATGREKQNESNQDDDATSKKTLEELEDDQKVSSGSPGSAAGPSPDGALDEGDEVSDVGPM